MCIRDSSTLHAFRSTLYAPRFTLHALRSTLYAPRFTLYAPRFSIFIRAVLVASHFEVAMLRTRKGDSRKGRCLIVHLYRQQVGVKVILASMQQKVGISVSALCAGGSKSDFGEHQKKSRNKCTMCALIPTLRSVCAMCARCMHNVCTTYARCMYDGCTSAQHIVVVCAYSARS